jgi:signal transduction histidine kinase
VDADKWISRKVWDERLMKRVLEQKEGIVHAKGADGVDRVFGVKAVAGLSWIVLAGLPEENVFAPVRARLLETGALLAVVVGIVMALAWGFVARLSKPITAIAAAVSARAEGNEEATVPIAGPVEVARVARELNRMIESSERTQAELARQAERLRIVHDIDRSIIAEARPEAIAAAVIEPLRDLLGVPRAIVNLFDLAAGEVEWLAAAGRRRVRVGPGVRYSIRMMGDVEGLKRGEPQRIDVHALPPGPEVETLLASGVHVYMAVPMIAGGELIGALSFGGEQETFPAEQVTIAQEVATQLAIAIAQARLFERVKRHAEELELRVRERTAQLEAANKELEAFSYSVSHDLRAPLRAIDGFSRIVQEDYAGKLNDEGRRLLGIIRDNSRKMAQLIDDLLEYSRLGRKPLSTAEIDMKRLVEKVLGELQMSGERPSRLEIGALPLAHGDAVLVKQAWANLLGNAVKFSSKRDRPLIEVNGHENGAENVYCVKDNGAGFDMKYYDKLFGVFQRLHSEEEFEGTGVGLAIVQRVVTRHGGRVWAEGKVDQGAAFYFSLPKGGEA